MEAHAGSRRVAPALLAAGLVAGLSVAAPYALVDDSYISFRYVQNLLAHGELVYNQGERVEGFTNLGWVLLLAVVASVVTADLPILAFATSVVLNAITLLRVWQLSASIDRDPAFRALAALLLGLNLNFLLATTNGLEAALYAYVLIEICASINASRLVQASVWSSLLFVIRPDGLVAGAALLTVMWLKHRSIRRMVPGAVILGFTVACVTAFRVLYYGDYLPNSIIAKSYDLAAIPRIAYGAATYLVVFLATSGYLVFPLLAAMLRARGGLVSSWRHATLFSFCAITLALAVLVVIRNGGDWMPNSRLLLQYGPVWIVACMLSIHRLQWSPLRRGALLLWPVAASAALLALKSDKLASLERVELDPFWIQCTQRLANVIAARDIVSAEALGYIGYHLPRTTFHDPIGLVDRHLARHGWSSPRYGKRDTLYTLSTIRPTVALWHETSHLRYVPVAVLDLYEIRAFHGGREKIIMIRRDAVPRIAPAFGDWRILPATTLQARDSAS